MIGDGLREIGMRIGNKSTASIDREREREMMGLIYGE